MKKQPRRKGREVCRREGENETWRQGWGQGGATERPRHEQDRRRRRFQAFRVYSHGPSYLESRYHYPFANPRLPLIPPPLLLLAVGVTTAPAVTWTPRDYCTPFRGLAGGALTSTQSTPPTSDTDDDHKKLLPG